MKFEESQEIWIEFYSVLIYFIFLGMVLSNKLVQRLCRIFSNSCVGIDEIKLLLDQCCHENVINFSKIFSLDGHMHTLS